MNPLQFKLKLNNNSIQKLRNTISKNKKHKNYPAIKFKTTKSSPEKINLDKELLIHTHNKLSERIISNIPLKTDNYTEKDIAKFFKKKIDKKKLISDIISSSNNNLKFLPNSLYSNTSNSHISKLKNQKQKYQIAYEYNKKYLIKNKKNEIPLGINQNFNKMVTPSNSVTSRKIIINNIYNTITNKNSSNNSIDKFNRIMKTENTSSNITPFFTKKNAQKKIHLINNDNNTHQNKSKSYNKKSVEIKEEIHSPVLSSGDFYNNNLIILNNINKRNDNSLKIYDVIKNKSIYKKKPFVEYQLRHVDSENYPEKNIKTEKNNNIIVKNSKINMYINIENNYIYPNNNNKSKDKQMENNYINLNTESNSNKKTFSLFDKKNKKQQSFKFPKKIKLQDINEISDKNLKDEDLISENNDSMLENLNNDIDEQNNLLNQSTSTILNTSTEKNQNSFNKEKCICHYNNMISISNYIKKYYKKYKKYPKTKLRFYKYGRLLGRGAFGKVNLSLHILTGRLVAIKSINKENLKNETFLNRIKTETSIMKILSNSKNIVKFYETYETKKHICIVMEYICAGDLLAYLKKRTKLTEPVAKFIFKQIILALKYIHKNNIVHRDIKLDNILLDLDNNIKICDFGVSKIITKNEILNEQCGTLAYIAPEVLLNKGYQGFGVDIWSSGILLYAMLNGGVPFKGNSVYELKEKIIKGEFKEIKNISNEANNIIKRLLCVDPSKRITEDEILKHPWLNDMNVNFWTNHNLFTNAEYILLAKSNVDYKNIDNKDNVIENFDISNIDTKEKLSQNQSKSIILAPFNSSMSDISKSHNSLDIFRDELVVMNNAIKFAYDVKEINRNYELNNNEDIDNGLVISPHDSHDKKLKEDKKFSDKKVNNVVSIINNEIKSEKEDKIIINEKVINEVALLGYDKSFIKNSLLKRQFNYATTCYHLIEKFFKIK